MADEKLKILIVDDEPEIRSTLSEILKTEGYETFTAENSSEGLKKIEEGMDLAMVDIKLGEEDGIDLLKTIKRAYSKLPVIMITGHGSATLATQAFKLGAHDFLEKPLRLLQVRTCVRNAADGVNLRRQMKQKSSALYQQPVYRSKIMKDLFNQTRKLSDLSESVVILGDSGSGKELVAHSLHFEGRRSQGPFIATNAASMPLNLAEDELFGHERGAFTSADRQRPGCFELASGGTLLLDEIGDMDLQIQAKILRVLEQGVVQRLGGSKQIRVDVRLVCATHRDLPSMAKTGEFRNDLWYRISAFVIAVPSLDKRKEDIPLMARHFLKRFCIDMGVVREINDDALVMLSKKSYPGNVRELKNIVMRLAFFCEQPVIDAACVSDFMDSLDLNIPGNQGEISGIPGQVDYQSAKNEFEKHFFSEALRNANGNITAAAIEIGMAQSNFSRKLKNLGLR